MEEIAIIADFKGSGFGFAKKIYEYILKIGEGKISVDLVNIEKAVFKDGEFKIKIANNVRRKRCFIVYDSNKSPSEWFTELVFLLEAIRFSSPDEINLVLPYTRFSRQDRKDSSRVSVNAKALADVISLYADSGMTCDLHSGQIQEFFSIPFDSLFSFPVLIKYLKEKHPEILEDLVIVSPDLGGGKRVESLSKRLRKQGFNVNVAFGHKTREKDNEVANIIIIGEVSGKNCLVVDDIIDTGNTMIKTGEILIKNGAKKVFAYGTHGLFTEGFDKFKVFDKIIVSDSLFIANAPDNLEVVSLVELFGEAIYRTVIGQSLSVLFN